ncbi:hypothetical protein KKE60_08320 [Patescibacteria group bacterium]|nr:hypothetical protein [Patescibacteria group bacterium]
MDKTYYGRKWELTIECLDGSVLQVGNHGFSGYEALKCVFDVNYPGYQGWYLSEFTIYNPMFENAESEEGAVSWDQITEGARVEFYAGYVEGADEGKNYNKIFSGLVFQVRVDREDIVDYKITLLCMDGAKLFEKNFISQAMERYSHRRFLNSVAARSYRKIDVGRISPLVAPEETDEDGNEVEPVIEEGHVVRGCTTFGSVSRALREEVKTNNSIMFMLDDTLQVGTLSDPVKGEYIDVRAGNGLIGTPQQIDYGITFRTLLNPNLILANPPKWVKLDLSSIKVNQQKAVIGKPLSAIPIDGFFKVAGVRHIGDTRGNAWYTDVVGYGFGGKIPIQLGIKGADAPSMLNAKQGKWGLG